MLIYCDEETLTATLLVAYFCLFKRSVHFQKPELVAQGIATRHPVMEADVSKVEKMLLEHRQF